MTGVQTCALPISTYIERVFEQSEHRTRVRERKFPHTHVRSTRLPDILHACRTYSMRVVHPTHVSYVWQSCSTHLCSGCTLVRKTYSLYAQLFASCVRDFVYNLFINCLYFLYCIFVIIGVYYTCK